MKTLNLCLSALLLLFGCNESAQQEQPLSVAGKFENLSYDDSLHPFYYGVASGDPTAESVILWTKVLPSSQADTQQLSWELASDSSFSEVLKSGEVQTDSSTYFTVNVEVDGLQPDQYYYYRFVADEKPSITGRTKTAPAGDTDELQFAVVSCNNYEGGYFSAFAKIAERDELDAVLHLGDYIYEYGPKVYGDSTTGRFHVPDHEIISLDDYNTRYAQYRLDKDLMRMHQMHPVVTIWDDHEIANNAYKTGAQNHQPEEGPYEERKAAAVKAYFEWMPIRQQPDGRLYRAFSFGNLAELLMLDERLAGRDAQLDSISDPSYESEERSLLGEEQFDWLAERLNNSQARWKIIGNQVIFSPVNTEIVYRSPVNLDAWDGYPAAQQQMAQLIRENEVENVIILSGDTHTSWAFETTLEPTQADSYDAETAEGAFAVEFGTPSISSGNINERIPTDSATQIAQQLMDQAYNPHLKFVDLSEHGYLLLSLTPDEATADWYFMEDISQPESKEYLGRRFKVKAGEHKLRDENKGEMASARLEK
ncbi:MAG: alkaline phosphatase D family protein [Cyclobacteriaceae bacterium]